MHRCDPKAIPDLTPGGFQKVLLLSLPTGGPGGRRAGELPAWLCQGQAALRFFSVLKFVCYPSLVNRQHNSAPLGSCTLASASQTIWEAWGLWNALPTVASARLGAGPASASTLRAAAQEAGTWREGFKLPASSTLCLGDKVTPSSPGHLPPGDWPKPRKATSLSVSNPLTQTGESDAQDKQLSGLGTWMGQWGWADPELLDNNKGRRGRKGHGAHWPSPPGTESPGASQLSLAEGACPTSHLGARSSLYCCPLQAQASKQTANPQ